MSCSGVSPLRSLYSCAWINTSGKDTSFSEQSFFNTWIHFSSNRLNSGIFNFSPPLCWIIRSFYHNADHIHLILYKNFHPIKVQVLHEVLGHIATVQNTGLYHLSISVIPLYNCILLKI